ncbi:MAG: HAD-IIA family hydrolase [Christensenellales bacterium]|jgi:NagD protein
MEKLRAKKGFIIDMDGVVYHGNYLLPGALEFVTWLQENEKRYLFLTNSPERSPRELSMKLERMGMNVDESHFYTSALATAFFLQSQCPGGSVYAIGEPGLMNALYDAGFVMNDINPDYVVMGETRNYSYQHIEKAVRLVLAGAKLIGTNPDLTGPGETGIMPACRSLIAPIERATGLSAYYVGKPNPMMMRGGLRLLGTTREETAIVGDRMDTDIIAGIETDLDTCLVLSGVTSREDLRRFPYRPQYILPGVGDIPG